MKLILDNEEHEVDIVNLYKIYLGLMLTHILFVLGLYSLFVFISYFFYL